MSEVDPDTVRKATEKLNQLDEDPDGVDLRSYEEREEVKFRFKLDGEEDHRLTGAEPAHQPEEADFDYLVPMKDEGNGAAWQMYADGDTPEVAQENALDKYEDRHGYRPQPNGEPKPVKRAQDGDTDE